MTLSLRSLAEECGIWIGAAVGIEPLSSDGTFCDVLAREFNAITPDNAMKFEHLCPEMGQYNFRDADEIVSFAQVHRMHVRGHTLVWHRRIPQWLLKQDLSRDQVVAVLEEHIFTVAEHFRGRVAAWDVINEAVEENGLFQDSFWLRGIGSEYLELAFRWANQADPGALLFYNEWGGEDLNRKSDAVYSLLQKLVQHRVPVHGIGLQMHVSLMEPPDRQGLVANMRRFADLGLQIYITEMDVQIHNSPGSLKQQLEAQAEMYREILEACFSISTFKGLSTWGVTDRYSWIPQFTGYPDAPLLFDESYQFKPAYWALLDVLQSR